MSEALNNVTTQNAYAEKTTLATPSAVRVNLIVTNAAIYWQHSDGHPRAGYDWTRPEEFLPPGLYSFDLQTAAVRVRSAVAGVPAQVSVSSRIAAEVGDG